MIGFKKFLAGLSPGSKSRIRRIYFGILSFIYWAILNRVNLIRYANHADRKLEIGPGGVRLPGFEAVNIVGGSGVDYVYDATKKLPFRSNTFALVYASHVLEHLPWYQTEQILKRWFNILRPQGILEIWVPDGLKIARAFVDAESVGDREYEKDGWYKYNERQDPCIWANGRLYSYGDGSGHKGHPNWHMATFSARYLKDLLERCGFTEVTVMRPDEVRGYDHGWINLGIRGKKP